jgi:hypothetical protein
MPKSHRTQGVEARGIWPGVSRHHEEVPNVRAIPRSRRARQSRGDPDATNADSRAANSTPVWSSVLVAQSASAPPGDFGGG